MLWLRNYIKYTAIHWLKFNWHSLFCDFWMHRWQNLLEMGNNGNSVTLEYIINKVHLNRHSKHIWFVYFIFEFTLLLMSKFPKMINKHIVVIPRAWCRINSIKEAKNFTVSHLVYHASAVHFTKCQSRTSSQRHYRPTSSCMFFFLVQVHCLHKVFIGTDNNFFSYSLILLFIYICIFFHLFIIFKNLLFERL